MDNSKDNTMAKRKDGGTNSGPQFPKQKRN